MRLSKEKKDIIVSMAMKNHQEEYKILINKVAESARSILECWSAPAEAAKKKLGNSFKPYEDFMFNRTDSFCLRISNEKGYVRRIEGRWKAPILFFYSSWGDTIPWIKVPNKARLLLTKHIDWEKRASLKSSEISHIAVKVQRILVPITTLKKLEETWPEGKDFYSDLTRADPGCALVSRKEIDEVSKALGLKTK